jgi:RNA polymerase sigma factor (sigma-70 family)
MTVARASTTELTDLCREESDRYRRGQPNDQGHCYELFRRAIVEQDQEAWTAVYEQYRRLVGRWVSDPSDRIDQEVNAAFAKFWQAIDPRSFVSKFTEIGKVIAFLQLCARSVHVDAQRKEERIARLIDLEPATGETRHIPSDQALDTVFRQELFETLEHWLRDEQERIVFQLSFKVGLRPREIAQNHPGLFTNINEVRRVKERVVLRLSTNPQLRAWWEDANPSR